MKNTAPAFIMSRRKTLLFLSQHPGTAGICKQCGCTHYNPCIYSLPANTPEDLLRPRSLPRACGWADPSMTLCDHPACVAQAAETSNHAALLSA
jgi:hypothetical protein